MRLYKDKWQKQILLHQSDAIIDIDWRPIYLAEKAQEKQEKQARAANYNTRNVPYDPTTKISEIQRTIQTGWVVGERYNLLTDYALIPKMAAAGYTKDEILDALPTDGDIALQRTLENFIKNAYDRGIFLFAQGR